MQWWFRTVGETQLNLDNCSQLCTTDAKIASAVAGKYRRRLNAKGVASDWQRGRRRRPVPIIEPLAAQLGQRLHRGGDV